VHAFVSVLALLLSKLVVRHLKQGGVHSTVSEALWELSELRAARLNYGRHSSPTLKEMAAQHGLPRAPTDRQQEMIQALGLSEILTLGPTMRSTDQAKSPTELPAD